MITRITGLPPRLTARPGMDTPKARELDLGTMRRPHQTPILDCNGHTMPNNLRADIRSRRMCRDVTWSNGHSGGQERFRNIRMLGRRPTRVNYGTSHQRPDLHE